ncbi:adenosine receptor A3 [Pholidichthys leucotaenia]
MVDTLRMLYGAFMVLSSVASACGNFLLLLVLLTNKDLWSYSMGLTVSFSLSDLALGLTVIPLGVHTSLTWPGGLSSESVLCQGSGFLLLLLQTSSIHSLAWATIYRFTEICFALSYHNIWTPRRSRAVPVLVWLFCLVNAALPLLGCGSYAYSEFRFLCTPSFSPDNWHFVVPWMVVGVMVPILITCSLYGYIVYVARKQARRGTFMCNELHCFYVPANNYLKSSVVMVTTSVCLLVCWLPYISVCLYEMFSDQQSPAVTSALSTWMVLTNAALNPWITVMTQTRYRAAVGRSFSRLTQSCPWSKASRESRPQSTTLHLGVTNCITTSKTTIRTPPPSTPKTSTSL